MGERVCRVETLSDGSCVRVQGDIDRETLEALAQRVRDDQARRCHALSDVPMPEIAQRIHGRETYRCGLHAGHDELHRWPENGPARAEWATP